MTGLIVRGLTAVAKLNSRVPAKFVTQTGLRAIAGRTAANAAKFGRGAVTSPSGSTWTKALSKLKGIGKDVALYLGVNAAIDAFSSDEDAPTTISTSDKNEIAGVLASQVDDELGYSDARKRSYSDSPFRNWNSARAYIMKQMIHRFIFRKDTLSGEPIADSVINSFMELSDHERLLLVNQLAILTKAVAASSDNRECILLAARQSLCSANPSPVMSSGADFLLNQTMRHKEREVYALAINGMYEGLVDELCAASAADMMDETTDFLGFDLFSDDKADSASEEVKANLALNHIFYKGAPTELGTGFKKWLREFSIDSDGQDDESDALKTIQSINRIHPLAKRFIMSVAKDENSRTDDIIG